MFRLPFTCRIGLLFWLLVVATSSDLRSNETSRDQASQLVNDALSAEVAGELQRREALLRLALQSSPNFAPARWHTGQIRVGQQWLSLPAAESRGRNDERFVEYSRRRTAQSGNLQGELALARWCRNNALDDVAQVHFTSALRIDPNNRAALRGLGLRRYRGMFLTETQVEQLREQKREAKRALDHWKPILLRWRRAIERGEPGERDAALVQLRKISDTAAIPALEIVLTNQDGRAEQLELITELIERLYGVRLAQLVRQQGRSWPIWA